MTDERILEIADSCDHDLLAFARAIAAEQQAQLAKQTELAAAWHKAYLECKRKKDIMEAELEQLR